MEILLLIYVGAAPIDLVSRFGADRTGREQTAQFRKQTYGKRASARKLTAQLTVNKTRIGRHCFPITYKGRIPSQ
jgi:hypothetical protein